jgi:hypothetical protein
MWRLVVTAIASALLATRAHGTDAGRDNTQDLARALAACVQQARHLDPEFDAYVDDDGTVNSYRTGRAHFAFSKCMHEHHHDLKDSR